MTFLPVMDLKFGDGSEFDGFEKIMHKNYYGLAPLNFYFQTVKTVTSYPNKISLHKVVL